MRTKAVIYVRVSSKEQEREGYSIPAQKKLLNDYARDNNFEVVRVFEESETAKQAGRKQFRRMLDFIEDNPECKDILVEKVDRMYRNFHDSVALQIDSRHLRIHFVKQNKILSKDSKSHEKLHHDIDLALSNYYTNNLSEEVIKGSDEKAEQGGWPGPAPIGYKNRLEDKTIIIHPEEGSLVQQAFEMAKSGQYSLRSLAKELYRRGLRSKRSRKELAKSSMSRMLSNPFYYGYFLRKGKMYKAAHEPLISKKLFDEVQEVMGFVVKPRSTKRQFTYRGTLTCDSCGCMITAEKKKGRYIYYHCTNGKGICDNVVWLREEKVEETIKCALSKIRLTKDIVEWTKENLLDASKHEQFYRENQVAVLTGQYQNLDKKISLAYDHMLEGKIDSDMWEAKTAIWKKEKEEIQQSLDTIELENSNFMKEGIRLMEVASRAHELFDAMTPDEKREIAQLVLSNPRVVNGSIEYDYKKPFGMFVNVTDLNDWRGGRDSNPRPPA